MYLMQGMRVKMFTTSLGVMAAWLTHRSSHPTEDDVVKDVIRCLVCHSDGDV